jgi:hypothetical protein
MNKKEKAIKIIRECDLYGLATASRGIYLESSKSMQEQATSWNEADTGRAVNYRSYPYWLTTVSGDLPIGITGPEDPDLLNAIE